jgi:hypothetical protein
MAHSPASARSSAGCCDRSFQPSRHTPLVVTTPTAKTAVLHQIEPISKIGSIFYAVSPIYTVVIIHDDICASIKCTKRAGNYLDPKPCILHLSGVFVINVTSDLAQIG